VAQAGLGPESLLPQPPKRCHTQWVTFSGLQHGPHPCPSQRTPFTTEARAAPRMRRKPPRLLGERPPSAAEQSPHPRGQQGAARRGGLGVPSAHLGQPAGSTPASPPGQSSGPLASGRGHMAGRQTAMAPAQARGPYHTSHPASL
jgi:hypothetical protein